MRRMLSLMLLAICLALPAAAQNLQCGAREQVLAALAEQAQTRRAVGLAGQVVMEMFASEENRRWTVTVTFADGRMCLLAHGVAFEPIEGVVPAHGTRL